MSQCPNSEPPGAPGSADTPTHAGLQLQLVEGALIVVAEAVTQHNGAIVQDVKKILAVIGAGDDLRQRILG